MTSASAWTKSRRSGGAFNVNSCLRTAQRRRITGSLRRPKASWPASLGGPGCELTPRKAPRDWDGVKGGWSGPQPA